MSLNLSLTTDFDFSLKEIQIVELIQKRFSSKEIADQRSLSEYTIKRHRQNIAEKAGTSGKMAFRKFIKNYPPPHNNKIIILFIDIIKNCGSKLLLKVPQKINFDQRTLHQVCKPW
jgi:DNA-binding CsgD family transcriptional regulator